MKIYVATKYELGARAEEIAQQLERAGHTITYRWWGNDQFVPKTAEQDFKAVMDADALVFIAEHKAAYSGALTEFGIALGRGIPVFVIGHAIDNNIFTMLPCIHRGIESLL